MYDDYDLDYTFTNDYHLDEDTYYEHHSRLDAHNLDENAYELDEYYARDTHDLEALAYRHYAWYNLVHIHTSRGTMYTHTKRQVRVTLDIECYEDLELDNINWNDVLGLEPNESVNIIIHDIDEFWWVLVPV